MKTSSSGLFTALGAQDVRTGDAQVDGRFVIKSQPEAFARRLFAAPALRERLLQVKPMNLTLTGGELTFERQDILGRPRPAAILFDLLTDVADVIEKMNPAPRAGCGTIPAMLHALRTDPRTARTDPAGLLFAGCRFAPAAAGLYSTFRTYGGRTKVLGLEMHLHRLYDPLPALGIRPAASPAELRAALRQVLAAFPAEEARVRVTVSTTEEAGTFFLALEAAPRAG